MEVLQIDSAEHPFDLPEVGRAAVQLLSRADAMGLLVDDAVRTLDWETILTAANRVSAAGIAEVLVRELDRKLEDDPAGLTKLLETITSALEESPLPEHEWPRMEALFALDQLADLLGVSKSSVRRYIANERHTPDPVAARLHTVARLVHELAGAYNDIGIRRWFSRKRTALSGEAPAQILSGDWEPNAEDVARVIKLAQSLSGSPAT